MKQSLFLMLFFSFVLSANAQDTLVFKNGKKAGGKFISGNGGLIYLKTETATVIYKTEEVASIMFCTPAKNQGASSGSSLYTNSSEATDCCDPCDGNMAGKGRITFECNMCSGEGKLEIINENRNERNRTSVFVKTVNQHHAWQNRQVLCPGKYNWTYNDSGNNASSGSFIIRAGEEKRIILFEKEK